MSDILDMLVRQDRVKNLLEKKKKEWTEEEKNKKSGGPITFGHEEQKDFDDFMDLIIEEDSDEEDSDEEFDDEEVDEEKEKLPSLPDDFVFTPPTIDEIVEARLDAYSSKVYHMEKRKFVLLCIQEGILDENQVFY